MVDRPKPAHSISRAPARPLDVTAAPPRLANPLTPAPSWTTGVTLSQALSISTVECDNSPCPNKALNHSTPPPNLMSTNPTLLSHPPGSSLCSMRIPAGKAQPMQDPVASLKPPSLQVEAFHPSPRTQPTLPHPPARPPRLGASHRTLVPTHPLYSQSEDRVQQAQSIPSTAPTVQYVLHHSLPHPLLSATTV